jgi:hypothetical protein
VHIEKWILLSAEYAVGLSSQLNVTGRAAGLSRHEPWVGADLDRTQEPAAPNAVMSHRKSAIDGQELLEPQKLQIENMNDKSCMSQSGRATPT